MIDKNRHSQPFIIVIAVTAILLILSQFNTKLSIAGFETKPIEALSDIVSSSIATPANDSLVAIKDSLALADSIALAESLIPIDSSNIIDYRLDTTTSLAHFFESLNATKRTKNKTRIAYFGDSMIEGDLISQDLRSCMQDTFGGAGVGFVPITSIVAGFRSTIIHSFGNWETYHLLKNPPANHVLGISGYGFVTNVVNPEDTLAAGAASWVKYVAVNQKHLNKFYEIKLLYGKSTDENYVVINGYKHALKGTNPVNELAINASAGAQSLKATFYCKTPVDIFGFSMESDSGVFVDNFSFRGNSGMPNTKVSQSIYSGTNRHLDYDLIILEYGLNAVSPKVKDYSWYEKGMDNVIKHLQASFPNTSILLVSVGDKSYRQNGVYETDPSVPLLVETQKRLAKNNKIAFWSLYDAMGGYGSMVKWVQGDTVLANKDYTHFNFKGAHKAGKMLFTKLMDEYKAYNKRNGNTNLVSVAIPTKTDSIH
ncbi:MAG: hypothetical protein WBM13_03165 [Bacteroidia bacterium]